MTSISVALCTYNGAPFLRDQLASLAGQTRPPDEVVVGDDRSSDTTLDILRDFAGSVPFPVRVTSNPERLGVPRNFSTVISRCTGSVIALCDQDDVWLPTKLEQQARLLAERPSAGAVFGDAELVDERLAPLGLTLFGASRFTRRRRQRFGCGLALDVLLTQPVVCGATLAFRSSFRELLLPIPATGLHDLWVSTLLAAVGEVAILPEPLIRYRQHGSNQIGSPATRLRQKLVRRQTKGAFGDEVAFYRSMTERLRASGGRAGAIELIQQKVRHLEFRHGRASRQLVPVACELLAGRYHRYSRGLESAGYDLVFRRTSAQHSA